MFDKLGILVWIKKIGRCRRQGTVGLGWDGARDLWDFKNVYWGGCSKQVLWVAIMVGDWDKLG